jgi:hypothetical protein
MRYNMGRYYMRRSQDRMDAKIEELMDALRYDKAMTGPARAGLVEEA